MDKRKLSELIVEHKEKALEDLRTLSHEAKSDFGVID